MTARVGGINCVKCKVEVRRLYVLLFLVFDICCLQNRLCRPSSLYCPWMTLTVTRPAAVTMRICWVKWRWGRRWRRRRAASQFCHASDFIRRVRILIFVLHRSGYLVGSGAGHKERSGKECCCRRAHKMN